MTVIKLLGFGDNDTTKDAEAVNAAMLKETDVSQYLFLGDGPYSDSGTKWTAMMDKSFGDKKDKLMISQGNHDNNESESDQTEKDIEAWMPGLKESKWLSSKIVGNVLIISMNTQDLDVEFPRDQFNFVKAELEKGKSLRASGQIDWIVILFHKPFFTEKSSHSPYTAVRFQYKDVFRDAQVDFCLSGHNHNTQLWLPMIPNDSQANGVGEQKFSMAADNKTFDFSKDHGAFFIVSGHAGHEWNSIKEQNKNVMYHRSSGKFGYTALEFDGKKAKVMAKDTDNAVLYEYNVTREGTITNPPPDPECPPGQHKDSTGKCVPDIIEPPPTGGGQIDQQKAMNFIKNSYKQNVGLLEEAPGFNKYWLWNDQLLGIIILKHIDTALAKSVEDKMNSFGVTMKTPWATLIQKYRNNFSVKGSSEPTISPNPHIQYSDYNGPSDLPVTSFADIAFLSAIHYHYLGDTAKSQQAYNAGKSFWDGTGMKDSGNITGEYAIYKIALGMLAEKITGLAPIGIPNNYFAKFQAPNGGITTDLTGGQPAGSQNVETTVAVLLATNPALLETTTVPPPDPTGQVVCPNDPPYHYDKSLGYCIPDLEPDPNIIPKCPTGYKWNSAKNICDKDGSNPPPPPCLQGECKDQVTNQCRPIGPDEIKDAAGFCRPKPLVTCPDGQCKDVNTGQCRATAADEEKDTNGFCKKKDTTQPGEGEVDSNGVIWFLPEVKGKQTQIVKQSRDEATDDRWSENIDGCEDGFEQTMIAKSIGTSGDAHFASKLGGSNHSGGGAAKERWMDLGIRQNGDIQLQWEGPHPSNHDFELPDTKQFIKNIGKDLEGNWIGLKWAQNILKKGGSPENGGVRWRMWVNTDIANDGKPDNTKWRLALDFIDGIDVKVIQPQDFIMTGTMDCEVRRSDTKSHEVYGGGLMIRPFN